MRSKILYVPLALALVVVLAVVAVALLDDDDGADPQNAAAVTLSDDETPPKDDDGSAPQGVEAVLSDGWDQAERYKANLRVEFQPKNRRTRLVGLETRVLRSAWLPPCVTLADGGTVPGGGYAVPLPPKPPPGFRRVRRLNRVLEPGKTDRFRLVFETPGIDEGIVALYEVEMALRRGGSEQPLRLGRFLVMTPFTLHGTEWKFTLATGGRARQQANEQEFLDYGPARASLRCFRRNRTAIAPFLTSEAERTPALDTVLEFVADSAEIPVPSTP